MGTAGHRYSGPSVLRAIGTMGQWSICTVGHRYCGPLVRTTSSTRPPGPQDQQTTRSTRSTGPEDHQDHSTRGPPGPEDHQVHRTRGPPGLGSTAPGGPTVPVVLVSCFQQLWAYPLIKLHFSLIVCIYALFIEFKLHCIAFRCILAVKQ